MTNAEKLLNEVVGRFFGRWGFILSFRTTSEKGIEAAVQMIHDQQRAFVGSLEHDSYFDKLFLDKEGFFRDNPANKMADALAEGTIRQAQVAVDAASIVFAHSVVDAAAFDFCRITALVAPRDWEPHLDQRQVTLSAVRESGYSEILERKLDEFFRQLERDSLLKKADYLLAKCKPPDKWSPMDHYAYDRDRLGRLDALRHEIIHGEIPRNGIVNCGVEVDFLMKTCMFFFGLVNYRYDLKVDPREAMRATALL
jgi:hypothetical protein